MAKVCCRCMYCAASGGYAAYSPLDTRSTLAPPHSTPLNTAVLPPPGQEEAVEEGPQAPRAQAERSPCGGRVHQPERRRQWTGERGEPATQ